MKKTTLLLAASLCLAVGCVAPEEKTGTPFCEDGCELPPNNNPNPNNQTPNNTTPNNTTPNNTTPNPELPTLKGLFISGHLGTYWDCPEEAYHADGSGGDSNGIADDGACAEGSECPTFTSCETAQVTISLSNGGDTAGENILVDRIELFGTDGVSRAVLPLVAVIDTATNAAFDGQVDVGEEIIVRVEFQGPYNAWELLQPVEADGDSSGDRAAGGGGIIETTFSSDNHADLTVQSGELYDIPAVDT